ncbi:hypothetical protein PS900_00335 [Pseudomonas fluorescens]|uniref:Uncharacterized protein n=1 Tax=Pseudomonas fluorescens TaxID=294 RepID=A0A8H2NM37_PSEFL|nr:hypothetical protein PS900_00335 [Pseudomonas fluorescens]
MELKLVSVRHRGNLEVHQFKQASDVFYIPAKSIKLRYDQRSFSLPTHRQSSLALLPKLRSRGTRLKILKLSNDAPTMLLRSYAYVLTLSVQP